MSLVVDEHRQYLSDESRVSAFRRAIAEVVKPGDVVVDLGSGTGVLGLLACRAGARRVYSLEATGMIEVARAVANANGFGSRIVFLKRLSTEATLPERADVVLCDQIGRVGFEAGLFPYLGDARRRFLKPGGQVIPGAVEIWTAPVECPDSFAWVDFWSHSPAGFDFTDARRWAANTGYPVTLDPTQLLGGAIRLGTLDLNGANDNALSLSGSATIARAGTLHGLGGWFEARLSAGVTMTNSPLSPTRIRRRNVFFPIDRPVDVMAGDEVAVQFQARPADVIVVWTVEIRRRTSDAPVARFSHSTLNGMLLSREDLERTHPAFVPKLSPRGEARRSVLELCDGRSLTEIEQEIHRRHPELFPSPAVAASFVAEVVTRDSI